MKRGACWALLCSLALGVAGCVVDSGNGGGRLAGGGTGIGGTGGYAGAESATGIGGTGGVAGAESGIGGTGFLAGTRGENVGIRGRITAFGSILVGGFKVELTTATVVRLGEDRVSLSELSLGQVVEVLAASDGARLVAGDVRIRYEAVGPVDGGGRQSGGIGVLGQTVLLSRDTVFAGDGAELTAAGTRLKVSGIRDAAGRILASRLEAAAVAEPDSLTGRVETLSPRGMVVSGLPVGIGDPSAGLPATGDIVTVRGRLGADGLVATGWRRDASVPFDGRAAATVIEAVPLPAGAEAGRRLAGMPYVVEDRDNVLAAAQGRMVRIFSRVGVRGELRPVTMPAPPSFRGPELQSRPGGAPSSWRQQSPIKGMPMSRGGQRR